MAFVRYIFLFFIAGSSAQDSDMIRDYFLYKNVRNVVGFSCGNITSDIQTVKVLNHAGISASIKPTRSRIDLIRFLNAEYWKLGVFLDLRCQERNATSILYEASERRMYDNLYNWLVLGTNMSQVRQMINDSAFSYVTDFVISVWKDDHYDLYDIYNHCKYRGGSLEVSKLGTWEKDNGLNITLLEEKFGRRRNYHGMKVEVAGIVLRRPKGMDLIQYLTSEGTEEMDNWPKFGFAMISHIAYMLNLTMNVTELTRWEKNDSNGPVMGGLKKLNIDLSYYPSILTKERFGYGKVLIQTWPFRTCFMFLTIPSSKVRINILVKPFAADTWYMIILFVIVASTLLMLILRLESIRERNACGNAMLIIVAALCQQGVSSPNQSAGRLAVFHVTVFGLLIYNYYSAAIVSARLSGNLNKMNDSLFSLVHSGMKLAAENNIFFKILLKNPSPDVQFFKRHWETIPEWKRFLAIEDGVEKISKGDFAYHADPNDIYPHIERQFTKQMICQLTEVHLFRPMEIGIWSSYNSQFREPAKIGLIRVVTAGLKQREVKRWSARKPYCQEDEIFVEGVTINEVAPIIFVLLIGMLLSIIVFFMERTVFTFLHGKKEKVTMKDKRYFNGIINNRIRLPVPVAKPKITKRTTFIM